MESELGELQNSANNVKDQLEQEIKRTKHHIFEMEHRVKDSFTREKDL